MNSLVILGTGIFVDGALFLLAASKIDLRTTAGKRWQIFFQLLGSLLLFAGMLTFFYGLRPK